MKRLFVIAALVLAAAVSCTKEIAPVEKINVDVVPDNYVPVTLSAAFDAGTKVVIDDKKVLWEVGEEVAVFADGAGSPIKFSVVECAAGEKGVNAKIAGAVPEGTKTFTAVYPYQAALSIAEGVVSVDIPAEQTITEGRTYDSQAFPSVAYYADAESVPVFRNVMSLVTFNVGQTEGVSEVRIYYDGTVNCAGELAVTVDKENAAPEIENKCEAPYVSVICVGGFEPGVTYTAAVAPAKSAGVSSISFLGNKAGIRQSDKELVMERNSGKNLGDLTEKAVWSYFQISNAEELKEFLAAAKDLPKAWTATLSNDIDCSDVEIGTAESYAGVFDGQGCSIKNWTSNAAPLFVTVTGTVKDFTIDASCKLNLPATLTGNVGFVACANKGVVSGITNNADISGDVVVKGGYAAAIIGRCDATGLGHGITVADCVNNGNITINTTGNAGGTQYVGTIMGSMGANAANVIKDCTNNGNLTINCSGKNTKNFYIGGITGGTTNGSKNISLVNNGDVTLTCAGHEAALCMAGISSYTTGEITNCENNGKVTFNSGAFLKGIFVAGIAGYYASNKVSGCVNRGDVTVEAAAILGRNNIGDLTGESGKEIVWSNDGKYAIAAGVTTGGIVSATGRNPSFENCENYGNVSLTLNDPLLTGYGTHTAARPSVGGMVGDCSGPMLRCNNHGNVTVVLGNGADFTGKDAGYTFHVGGIVGSSWNFTGPTTKGGSNKNTLNKFTLEDCNNSGNVSYTSYNLHTTNNTVGGICGWPQSEDLTAVYVAKNCSNSGDVSFTGNARVRVGGIHGGTGRMEGCSNTGNISIESAQKESVAGSVAGFHSQNHTFSKCAAGGKVEAKSVVAGLGGLVGLLGNVATTAMDGSSVNCELVGGPEGKTGLILGAFNGTSKKIVLGSEEDPIKIAGSIDGTAVSAENVKTYFCGNTGMSFDNHTVYYSLGGQSYVFPTLVVKRLWGFYKDSTPWYDTSKITGVSISHPDGYGMARSLAMDDEYIYLPKSSAYANIAAVSIADKTSQKALNKTGIAGGSTFTTSFVRMIKNTDAEVNGGKDVLLVCNLTATDSDANQLRLYAYKDGVDAAPTQIAGFCWDSANNVNDWRRYGDRFFVTGTWQEGKVYFPSFNPNKIVVLSIANGARTAVTQIAAGENSPSGIKDLTVEGENLFITNASVANMVAATGNLVNNGWNEYALTGSSDNGKGTWGYNFFTLGGKKYIAYARIIGENKAQVEVIRDKGDLLTSLAEQEGLIKLPIHDAEDLDKEVATGGLADCCVRVIDGKAYVAALTRDGGFVLDMLYLE